MIKPALCLFRVGIVDIADRHMWTLRIRTRLARGVLDELTIG
jgi:hypothetical protein